MTAKELVDHITSTYAENEPVAYYVIGHSELHALADKEAVAADCRAIDMALGALTFNMGRHFNSHPAKPLMAAVRAAVDVSDILDAEKTATKH